MDIFTKLNRKNIQDRQIDTLIGLSKGITADGKVAQAEAEFLQSWLVQNCHSENPLVINLLGKVGAMLQDGVLDDEESAELFALLHSLSGEKSEIGEISKSSRLPICNPAPDIVFPENTFLFTGTCAFGTRRECQNAIEDLGGINLSGVTKSLNFLVLGTYVTDSWAHESFGRKIEKAMAYRDSGQKISIVSEEHWLRSTGLF
ncbi:BRCT domain-containing protein [Pseudohongiella sp.]|nr:BRCT domain-containing protein [Pseudohongiella sp.]HDZ07865.1 NAD-dependent DNA ligase [Pseudohongiella sp.]HEA61803.1 NAD-dependent DNA ligase [Pseudohongiella sp.]